MRFARPRHALLLACALMLGVTACASGGGGTSTGTRRGSGNKISADELATMSQFDVYTAVSRLRPQWIRGGSRGVPAVIMNGTPQNGGLDMLRTLRTSEVSALEFMSAADATTRFGTGYQAGAILVTSGR